MRRILAVTFALLFTLFTASAAHAQYGPPPLYPTQSSTTPFWAAGLSSQVAASGSSARVILSVATSSAAPQVQVNNTTTAIAFVVCADVSVVAAVGTAGTATSSYVVAPGSVIVMTPQSGSTYCAAILSTGSGSVYFTPGAGQ